MIRLWLSRGVDSSPAEQLSAQLMLGIVSGRLAAGERLPSVRALARTLRLHPNTVSAVYRGLAQRGWVTGRRGSGVYVRSARVAADAGIDAFAARWVEAAIEQGYTPEALEAALARVRQRLHDQRLLVVDPDPQLARIIAAEISEAVGERIASAGCEEACGTFTASACVLATEASLAGVQACLGPVEVRTIRLKSMQEFLVGRERPALPTLVAVASRSEALLRWAGTLLAALGFSMESILLRNTGDENWQDGLGACGIVGVDVVTALELTAAITPVVIRIVSDDFLAEMRAVCLAQRGS